MKKRIGVGIVGWGFMGRAHTYGYRNMPLYYRELPFEIDLVGVCTRTVSKCGDARQLGYRLVTDELDELLSRDDIDAIHVCTPNSLHENAVTRALAAGKHVYCDKPMAGDLEQAAAMLQASRERPELTAQMAFNLRFFPAILRAKQLIEAGALGRITQFSSEYLHSGSVEPVPLAGWKVSKAQSGGGVVLDLCSHQFDLLRFLGCDFEGLECRTRILHPQRPDGAGSVVNVETEDAAFMLAQLKCGAYGTICSSKIATGTGDLLRLELYGTKGAIRFDSERPISLYYYDQTAPKDSRGFTELFTGSGYPAPGGGFPSSKNSTDFLRSHAASVYSFVRHVADGQPGDPSFDDGYKTQRLCDCAYRSAISGRFETL